MHRLCSWSGNGPASQKHNDMQEFMTVSGRTRSNDQSPVCTLLLRILKHVINSNVSQQNFGLSLI
jgi:hypothetical protein